MMDWIFRGATLVHASGQEQADLAVEDGQIVYIGPNPGGRAREEVDATGAFLLPGGIDTHVHFRDPGHPHKEDFASGSRAAISGGVTTVCDMPNTSPPTLTRKAWEEKAHRAAATSFSDFGIWVGAASDNHQEIRGLMEEKLACGIKVFMGASTGPLLVDDPTLERLFAHTTGLMGVHAEDERQLDVLRRTLAHLPSPEHNRVRPPDAAVAAVRRLLELQRAQPRPLHICHLSTAAELALVEAAEAGWRPTVEVSPHHLWLDTGEDRGNLGKVNPPIRAPADRAAVVAALRGGQVDTLGSDHAPHTLAEKARPYWEAPSGLPGVETQLALMLRGIADGLWSWEQVVSVTATRPAEIFGFRQKGKLAVGYDADLVLIRPAPMAPLRRADLLTRVGWSPYEGMLLPPKPDGVWLRGRKVAARGHVLGPAGGVLVRPS